MRAWQVVLIAGLVIAEPKVCRAQETHDPGLASASRTDVQSRSVEKPADSADNKIRRLLDKWQPVRERMIENDRLRTVSSVVGLGVLAVPSNSLPVGFIGAEALRIGLHPQLEHLRERTGYTVEPSVGPRRFEVTFRKTFD